MTSPDPISLERLLLRAWEQPESLRAALVLAGLPLDTRGNGLPAALPGRAASRADLADAAVRWIERERAWSATVDLVRLAEQACPDRRGEVWGLAAGWLRDDAAIAVGLGGPERDVLLRAADAEARFSSGSSPSIDDWWPALTWGLARIRPDDASLAGWRSERWTEPPRPLDVNPRARLMAAARQIAATRLEGALKWPVEVTEPASIEVAPYDPVARPRHGQQLGALLSGAATRRILLIGEGGSGKSVLLLRTALELLDRGRLAVWSTVGEYVHTDSDVAFLERLGEPLPPAAARGMVLLLDGLDEAGDPARAMTTLDRRREADVSCVVALRGTHYSPGAYPGWDLWMPLPLAGAGDALSGLPLFANLGGDERATRYEAMAAIIDGALRHRGGRLSEEERARREELGQRHWSPEEVGARRARLRDLAWSSLVNRVEVLEPLDGDTRADCQESGLFRRVPGRAHEFAFVHLLLRDALAAERLRELWTARQNRGVQAPPGGVEVWEGRGVPRYLMAIGRDLLGHLLFFLVWLVVGVGLLSIALHLPLMPVAWAEAARAGWSRWQQVISVFMGLILVLSLPLVASFALADLRTIAAFVARWIDLGVRRRGVPTDLTALSRDPQRWADAFAMAAECNDETRRDGLLQLLLDMGSASATLLAATRCRAMDEAALWRLAFGLRTWRRCVTDAPALSQSIGAFLVVHAPDLAGAADVLSDSALRAPPGPPPADLLALMAALRARCADRREHLVAQLADRSSWVQVGDAWMMPSVVPEDWLVQEEGAGGLRWVDVVVFADWLGLRLPTRAELRAATDARFDEFTCDPGEQTQEMEGDSAQEFEGEIDCVRAPHVRTDRYSMGDYVEIRHIHAVTRLGYLTREGVFVRAFSPERHIRFRLVARRDRTLLEQLGPDAHHAVRPESWPPSAHV